MVRVQLDFDQISSFSTGFYRLFQFPFLRTWNARGILVVGEPETLSEFLRVEIFY